MIRGRQDEWYSQQKFDEDTSALRARGVGFGRCSCEGGHEWHEPVIDAAAAFIEEVGGRSPEGLKTLGCTGLSVQITGDTTVAGLPFGAGWRLPN